MTDPSRSRVVAPAMVRTPGDPSSDILRYRSRPLDAFFAPRAVAVIGATDKPGSVGRTVFANLLATRFGGNVYPVNPNRPEVLGQRTFPDVAAIPEQVDLAVVVTPPATVPGLLDACGRVGVRAAIVISAGFKEVGPEGAELERQVVERARAHGMRVIGPNCLGVMSPVTGLNATFAAAMPAAGRVAFVSQSGALITAVLDWSLREQVGFSSIVSLGSMADVGWGDLITHLGDDRHTESIVLYMETVGDARSFLSAAREVALTKPIIVMKPGRTAQAAQAAASHTGSMAGSDEVLDAAFRRAGILRAERIADLFYLAEVLGKQPRPRGRRLAIVSNAGGPGVLATDALVMGGGELAPLSTSSLAALNEVLPATWSHANPIDIIGDAPPERYAAALDIAAADPGSDALLVILTPQAMTDPTRTAQALVPFGTGTGKLVMASWMGGRDVQAGRAILREAGIATFLYPDSAASMFNSLWGYDDDLRALYETPELTSERSIDREAAARLIARVRAEGRTLLTEAESKELLSAYGIAVTETHVAGSVDDAVAAARAIGYPVVLKLFSHTVTHKTDVDGVQLDIADDDAVRAAYAAILRGVTDRRGAEHFQGVTVQPMIDASGYELIIGSTIDPQFGPVLLFGLGGQLVEVFRDRSLALPPLTTTLARRMMERTRVFTALQGVRGRDPVDIGELEQLLVRFGQLVVEHPAIAEVDINPLLVSPTRQVALDARVILQPPDVTPDRLARPAIRPYPLEYVAPFTAPGGASFLIRPIRPDDEQLVAVFHRSLSPDTVYSRYFSNLTLDQRTAHERLVRICFADYDRDLALVAVEGASAGADGAPDVIAAIGRLSRSAVEASAEFAIVVGDGYQGRGLGTELLRRLVDIGRREGIERIEADILPTNGSMLRIAQRLGFTTREAGPVVRAELSLR